MWYVIAAIGILAIVVAALAFRIYKLMTVSLLIFFSFFLICLVYVRFDSHPKTDFYVASLDNRDGYSTIWTLEGEEIRIRVSNYYSVKYSRTDGGLIVVYMYGQIIGYRWLMDPDMTYFQYVTYEKLPLDTSDCRMLYFLCNKNMPENPPPDIVSNIDLGFKDFSQMLKYLHKRSKYVSVSPRYPSIFWAEDEFIFFYVSRESCVFATNGTGRHWHIDERYAQRRGLEPRWRILVKKFPSNWKETWLNYESDC